MNNRPARTNNRRQPALALAALALLALAPAAHAAHARHDHSPHTEPTATSQQAQRAARPRPQQQQQAAAAYVCPMHADVTSPKPGRCPECGMNLKAAGKTAGAANPEGAAHSEGTSAAVPTADKKADATGEALRIPDLPVLDQHGRRLNFYSDLVRGKTVAINFVFTTCTTVCPPLSATFRRVQQELGARAGRDIELISISVDPSTDTPERLKSFSEKFKAGPGWTFVTGGKPEIDTLLKALGASAPDKNAHTPMILVGNDAAAHWTRTYGLAPASTLVKVIDEAAGEGAGRAQAGEPSAAAPAVEKLPVAAPGDKSAAGDQTAAASSYFPNHVLLTQDNKPVRFYDDMLKGKIVLINFMFTTCAGVCSPMTANLAKVQSYLGERVGRDVWMVSITVDPTTDTPEALKAYAAKHKAGPGWSFLTGKKENVDWVLYKLGGYTEDKAAHSGVLIIGNEATGEWLKVHAMSKPSEIAAAVIKLAGKGNAPPSQ
jgi:cytochrome oxidase Cu insertion factor (SCO1/SenC/PrrC family)